MKPADNYFGSVTTCLACAWVLSVGLLPKAFSAGGPAVRYEDFIMILMVGATAMKASVRKTFDKDALYLLRTLAFTLGAFTLCAIISTLTFDPFDFAGDEGTFGFGRTIESAKEIARLLKLLLLVVGFSSVRASSWKPVVGTIVIVSILLVTVQILQYSGFPGLNEWVATTYMGDKANIHVSLSDVSMIDVGGWRSGSLLVNPNDLGSFLMLPFLLFAGLAMNSSKPQGHGPKARTLAWFAVTCFTGAGILLTQSRSAILVCLVMTIWLWTKMPKINRPSGRIGLSLAILVVCVFATVIIMSIGAFQRVTPSAIVEGFTSGSMRQKLDWTLLTVSDMNAIQIVFGVGPSATFTVDNEPGYVVTWYGVVGFSFYIYLMWTLYWLPRRCAADPRLVAVFETALIGCLLAGFSGAFVLNNRIFPLFLAFMTLLVVCRGEHTSPQTLLAEAA